MTSRTQTSVTTRRADAPPQPQARRPEHPPSRAGLPCHDLDAAWQLLAVTSELPGTERGLLAVLTDYRHALHALACQLEAARHGQPPEPDTPPRQSSAQHAQPGSRP